MSTPGAITLLTGNPTRQWNADWGATRRVSCFDSSRVDPKFIEMMRKRYGIDSAAYAIRVMGEFPPAEEDTFIPYFLIDEAMHRDIKPLDNKRQVWDVARSPAASQ
jgi:phage terminase large subunit